jgi:hypothetical protein
MDRVFAKAETACERRSGAHTPGPWRIVGGTEVRAGARIVCDTASHHNVNAEADARLVAAAPDLLAVLRDVAALLPCAGRLHPKDLHALQDRVVAAIAKVQP